MFSRFTRSQRYITVVSGLPRSGTSLMMQILAAGGMPILTDEHRPADRNNPRGYYEFERVKRLHKGDTAWIRDAQGKAVKVISALLIHLPRDYAYRVIFMRRDLDEILNSQQTMLTHLGKDSTPFDRAKFRAEYESHLAHLDQWRADQPHLRVIDLAYADLIAQPAPHLTALNQFLDDQLNLAAMHSAIDPTLYRQRKP
ncbi:MAG: sulfotransferase [Anaerolineae bacterium]|nr:sulfotransferase [Anaerolineae bacterium]